MQHWRGGAAPRTNWRGPDRKVFEVDQERWVLQLQSPLPFLLEDTVQYGKAGEVEQQGG